MYGAFDIIATCEESNELRTEFRVYAPDRLIAKAIAYEEYKEYAREQDYDITQYSVNIECEFHRDYLVLPILELEVEAYIRYLDSAINDETLNSNPHFVEDLKRYKEELAGYINGEES